MPTRNIIRIDEEKCNGCGQCVTACAEGALAIINGKAKLISDTYCDGLGACLGQCPQDAITIEQRPAGDFDQAAVNAHLATQKQTALHACPGAMSRRWNSPANQPSQTPDLPPTESALSNWPVQLNLLAPSAPFLQHADLLLAADCVPFAMPDFHAQLLPRRRLAIACPKLDDTDAYLEKLTAIFQTAQPNSLTVVHMEVPCCSGLTQLARNALTRAGLQLPFDDITISIEGQIINRTVIPPVVT